MRKLIFVIAASVLFSVFALEAGAETRIKETDDGILYSISDNEVTVEGFNYAGSVMRVPDKIDGLPVRYIAPQACRGNSALGEVILPSTIRVIGEYAFGECPNLTKVVMDGGYEIGVSAFRGSKALMSVTLPGTLEKIGDYAFENCTMLGKLKIPSSLKEIGIDAFAGCDRVSFRCGGNSYAKEYAKQYSIPTSFSDTWEFTVMMIVLTSAFLGSAVFGINKLIKRKSKRP